MGTTFFTISLLLNFLVFIFFVSSKFIKKNKEYTEKYPVRQPKNEEALDSVEDEKSNDDKGNDLILS
jgi:hypothetical protein